MTPITCYLDFISPYAYLAFEALPQRAVKAKVADAQDHARVGAPPEHRLTWAEPRENALPIGFDQASRCEILACSQQTRCWRVGTPGQVHRRQRL